jgi:hypothetical protein
VFDALTFTVANVRLLEKLLVNLEIKLIEAM